MSSYQTKPTGFIYYHQAPQQTRGLDIRVNNMHNKVTPGPSNTSRDHHGIPAEGKTTKPDDAIPVEVNNTMPDDTIPEEVNNTMPLSTIPGDNPVIHGVFPSENTNNIATRFDEKVDYMADVNDVVIHTKSNRKNPLKKRYTTLYDSLRSRVSVPKTVLLPSDKYYILFEQIILLTIIYNVIFGLYDVAFVRHVNVTSVNFIIQMLILIIYYIDFFIHFFIAYRGSAENGQTIWKTSRFEIYHEYFLSFRFFINLFALVPYDVIVYGISQSGKDIDTYPFLVLLRLLTIAFSWFKLLTLAKRRHLFDHIMISSSFSYAKFHLIKFVILLIVTEHILACFLGMFGLISHFEYNWSWIDAVADGQSALSLDPILNSNNILDNTFNIYILSFYWSVTTITSIGYGDITAQTRLEYIVSTIVMIISSMIWAYIIGSVCGLVATLDLQKLQFEQTVDSLKVFSKHHSLPKHVQSRIRRYFFSARQNFTALSADSAQKVLTKGLRGEIAETVARPFLEKTWFFSGFVKDYPSLISHIASGCTLRIYPPGENLRYRNVLSLLQRGIVSIKDTGGIQLSGYSWGTDFGLMDDRLIRLGEIKSVTFCHVLECDSQYILDIFESYPIAKTLFRRLCVKQTMIEYLRLFGAQSRQGEVSRLRDSILSTMPSVKSNSLTVPEEDFVEEVTNTPRKRSILFKNTQSTSSIDQRFLNLETRIIEMETRLLNEIRNL